jgi:hypothetical protein
MHTFFKYDVAGYPIENFRNCLLSNGKTGYLKQNISIKKMLSKPFHWCQTMKGFFYEKDLNFIENLKFVLNKTAFILEPIPILKVN